MRKRALDLTVASVALVLFAPVLLVIALLVRLDSPGPAFYRGRRAGKDGRIFRIWKIRTMVVDADRVGPPLTAEDDPRITRVGRALRQTRLDELPQLINVITGEMSLVGPTPEHPDYVALYSPEQHRVLSVRPGMTSPAALAFSDEERILAVGRGAAAYTEAILPVKLDLELAYVRGRSLSSDLAILARTLALLFPKQRVRLRRISNIRRSRLVWVLIDGPVVAIGFLAAYAFHVLETSGASPRPATPVLGGLLLLVAALYVGCNYVLGVHRYVWRYATVPDVGPLLVSTAISTGVAVILDLALGGGRLSALPPGAVVLGGLLTFCGFVTVRYRSRLLGGGWRWKLPAADLRMRTLIYGAGEAGQLLAWRLLTRSEGRTYHVVGFLDDDRAKRGLRIHGIEVLGNRFDLSTLVEREQVELIILAISNITGEKLRAIVAAAQDTPAQIKIAPGAFQWMGTANGTPLVREVRVEDLLGRQPAALDRAACQQTLGNKVVMVTGACGSIGSELCRQIARFDPRRLVIVDNNETGIYDLELELRMHRPALAVEVVVADVTDRVRMQTLFGATRPQVIFHGAAYKHVPLMEQHPEEAVRVNVGGTRNTLDQARRLGAERFVLVSTDKAVNPSSVMGATKRLAELLVMSDDTGPDDSASGRPLCTAVRFGNVLGSRGSVVPTFARQIELGGPVTVTHPEMTRYFMDVSEATGLIIQAAALTEGRDIFMLDMGERIRIDDLARKMIRMRGLRPQTDIPIVYTGIRPGEKLHEELAYSQEAQLPTAHRLITRLSGQRIPDGVRLRPAIGRLLELAAGGNRELLVPELLRLSRSGVAPAEVLVAR